MDEEKNELNIDNEDDDNKKANQECCIAVLLNIIGFVCSYLYASVFFKFGPIIAELLFSIGFILMIHVRIKYPKNTFGKILMIMYILVIIFAIISFIVFIYTCISCAQSCPG